jgi:hypothetical protein
LGFLFGGQIMDTDKAQLDKLAKSKFFTSLKVVEVEEQKDGTARITFDVSEGFKKEYKQAFGLSKWSDKHFERFVVGSLKHYIDQKQNRQVQNPDFLWTQPEANNE